MISHFIWLIQFDSSRAGSVHRPFFSFSGHFSCSMINWKLFYDPKHISSVQWSPLLAQEQTLMLLGIIHQEKTLGRCRILRGSESINISSCSESVCVSKMLFNASAEVCAQGCRYSASGSVFHKHSLAFSWRRFCLSWGCTDRCVWKRDGSLSEDKTTVIEYKPLRTTSQTRHYIKSALSSITNAFQVQFIFVWKLLGRIYIYLWGKFDLSNLWSNINSIKVICIALFTIQIIAKQLYRKM